MNNNNYRHQKAAVLAFLLITIGACGTNEDSAQAINDPTLELPIIEIPNITQGVESYFSPDSKSIIYSGSEADDTISHVYTINIDGTNRKRINNEGADASSFFHPNGKDLIWTSTRDNQDLPLGNWDRITQYPAGAEIYSSDLNGENIKRWTFNKYYDAEVTYPRDASKLLFARVINGEIDLWLFDPDGSERQITHTQELQEGGAQFLPDNETILFRAWQKADDNNPNRDIHLYTIRYDGTNLTQITTKRGSHWAPYPAPDGIHAVYAKKVDFEGENANYELYLINLKTKKEKRLTYFNGFDGFPSISPDGKYISFTSNRPSDTLKSRGKRRIFLLDASSLNIGPAAAVADPFADSVSAEKLVTVIPNITAGAEAYFSPDGKSLIYNGKEDDDASYHVYTINIDGTNRKRINNVGDDACSFFHPHKKEIVWTSTRDNLDLPKGDWSLVEDYPQGAELYFSDLDGNNVRRITNNKHYDAEVGFSPDGTQLLFARQINGEIDLWLANADGSNQHQITYTPDLQEGGSQFLPDSKTILFRAWKKSEQQLKNRDMHIYTVSTDGTNLKQITTEPGTQWAPYPAPDGVHAVFVKVLPPHNYDIFLLNLQTGEEKRLTHNAAFDGFPSISPDGKYVAFSSGRDAKEKRGLKLYLLDISSLDIGPKN